MSLHYSLYVSLCENKNTFLRRIFSQYKQRHSHSAYATVLAAFTIFFLQIAIFLILSPMQNLS